MAVEPVFEETFPVKGGDFSRAGAAACRIKALLKDMGFDQKTVRRAAIASYEAEMNIIMYAEEGRLSLAVSPGGVRIKAEDRGPGIEDIGLAMTEGYSTATKEMRELGFGAGMGLPNIKKNSDVFHITSQPGRGTRLEIVIKANGHRK